MRDPKMSESWWELERLHEQATRWEGPAGLRPKAVQRPVLWVMGGVSGFHFLPLA